MLIDRRIAEPAIIVTIQEVAAATRPVRSQSSENVSCRPGIEDFTGEASSVRSVG